MITKACVIIFDKSGKKYTIPCHRHSDAYWIISQFLSQHKIDRSRTIEGFLDEENNFYNRYEAYDHAVLTGQIIDIREADDLKICELYSEDLW